MLDARTAWAIALLLAPTGAAVAGVTTTASSGHTAYVELTIDENRPNDLASIQAFVVCQTEDPVEDAMAWLGADGCSAPPGAAIYVTNAEAPAPTAATMTPTGTMYTYEDGDRVWTVYEYTYGDLDGDQHHAYVLSPDLADRVTDVGAAEPVRGVVDMAKLGIEPGETGALTTSLAAGPDTLPQDPTVERVDAAETAALAGEPTG